MKKIVIIGGSPAAAKIIEEIRSLDQESEIKLFAVDGYIPYDREKFPHFLADEIDINGCLASPMEFYQSSRVEVITDQKISRINLKRNKIFTEEKTQYEYDVLFMGDTPDAKFEELKGANKTGVYGLNRLEDIYKIHEYIPLVEHIVVQSDSISGFEAAVAMAKRKKDVTLVVSQDGILAQNFSGEQYQSIIDKLEEKGVKVAFHNQITEILGEGDVKAVRLNSGKVLAADLIILSGRRCDLRFLGGELSIENHTVKINDYFQTDMGNVFAFDKLIKWSDENLFKEEFISLDFLFAQGVVMGKVFGDQEHPLTYPAFHKTVDCEGMIFDFIGQITLDYENNDSFDNETNVLKRLKVDNGILKGAVLLNNHQNADEYYQNLDKEFVAEEPLPSADEFSDTSSQEQQPEEHTEKRSEEYNERQSEEQVEESLEPQRQTSAQNQMQENSLEDPAQLQAENDSENYEVVSADEGQSKGKDKEESPENDKDNQESETTQEDADESHDRIERNIAT